MKPRLSTATLTGRERVLGRVNSAATHDARAPCVLLSRRGDRAVAARRHYSAAWQGCDCRARSNGDTPSTNGATSRSTWCAKTRWRAPSRSSRSAASTASRSPTRPSARMTTSPGLFGSVRNFMNFLNDCGVERVCSFFYGYYWGSPLNPADHGMLADEAGRYAEAAAQLGASRFVARPMGPYFKNAPITDDKIKTVGRVLEQGRGGHQGGRRRRPRCTRTSSAASATRPTSTSCSPGRTRRPSASPSTRRS